MLRYFRCLSPAFCFLALCLLFFCNLFCFCRKPGRIDYYLRDNKIQPALPICSDEEVRFKLQVETSGLILELGLPAELPQNRGFNDLLADNAQVTKIRQLRLGSSKIGHSNLRIFIYDTLLRSFIE